MVVNGRHLRRWTARGVGALAERRARLVDFCRRRVEQLTSALQHEYLLLTGVPPPTAQGQGQGQGLGLGQVSHTTSGLGPLCKMSWAPRPRELQEGTASLLGRAHRGLHEAPG